MYGNMKTNEQLLSKYAMMFHNTFFVLRRLVFALAIVFLAHRPSIQIAIMLLTCVVAVFYYGTSKPFSSPMHNTLHIVNEVTLMILLDGMWLLQYMIDSPYVRWGLGYALIGVACLNLLIHLAFLTSENVLSLFEIG